MPDYHIVATVNGVSVSGTASLPTPVVVAIDPLRVIEVTAPNIITLTLPVATQNASYSATITAVGGRIPATWTVLTGTLPTGLTLSTAGVLSGTPTVVGASVFTVAVTDVLGQVDTAVLSLTVNAAAGGPTVSTSTPLPQGTQNAAYTVTLAATGGTTPFVWSVNAGSTLPAGLSLSAAGVLSGTPTAAATSSFTLKVTDALTLTNTKAFSLTVAAAGVEKPSENFGTMALVGTAFTLQSANITKFHTAGLDGFLLNLGHNPAQGGNAYVYTTVAAGSNGLVLPTSPTTFTLQVAAAVDIGTHLAVMTASGPAQISYTGISGNSYTGCVTIANPGYTLATGNKVANWPYGLTRSGKPMFLGWNAIHFYRYWAPFGDWWSESDWTAVKNAWATHVAYLLAFGHKGVFMDMENYPVGVGPNGEPGNFTNGSLWSENATAAHYGHTVAETRAQITQRGAELMAAMVAAAGTNVLKIATYGSRLSNNWDWLQHYPENGWRPFNGSPLAAINLYERFWIGMTSAAGAVNGDFKEIDFLEAAHYKDVQVPHFPDPANTNDPSATWDQAMDNDIAFYRNNIFPLFNGSGQSKRCHFVPFGWPDEFTDEQFSQYRGKSAVIYQHDRMAAWMGDSRNYSPMVGMYLYTSGAFDLTATPAPYSEPFPAAGPAFAKFSRSQGTAPATW